MSSKQELIARVTGDRGMGGGGMRRSVGLERHWYAAVPARGFLVGP